MRQVVVMMFFSVTIFVLVSCNKDPEDPGLVGFDYAELLSMKKQINKGEIKPAYETLIREADDLLGLESEKVTDGDTPPSGDNHDFFAIGKYSWPNPDTPDGMPYIRVDCNINPEANGFRYDLARYNNTVERVKTLSLAWFYSHDEKYAKKASELLRVWFIDDATKMNPHFEFASALPGVYNGMAIGVIFGVTLVEMVDCVKLLTLSESWTDTDNNALKDWFSGYVKWLLESEFGLIEKAAKNNHGTWYSAQIAVYSLYTGNMENVRDMIEFAKRQIDEQISADGSLPNELHRDWAFSYSVFGLRAFTALALCAEHTGEDLWNYKTDDGRSLQTAYTFLVPYLLEKKQWQWGIAREGEQTNYMALPMMHHASEKYNSQEINQVVEYLTSKFSLNLRRSWI
jgi:Alginate lyase.